MPQLSYPYIHKNGERDFTEPDKIAEWNFSLCWELPHGICDADL